ncbi:MAG: cytochrome c [Rhodoferax sp.]|uniref:c-type cytochrome n=1 Tax=Rhodoferax sp. TaxID=50421 RepID=UPI001B554306|nr:cytochrome c [Rhodoferax sp.]MBP9903959.1 cytochrome c [Rhodoferax sp.]
MLPTFKFAFTLVSVALLLGACSEKVKDTHPQQLVSKRQALFKQMTKTLEPMGLVARERQDYVKSEFQANAVALEELSRQPWVLFAADGNYPPTRAKASVWQSPAEFKSAQDDYLATVNQLVKVSASADLPAIRNAVDAVEKSCKSCHTTFRNER